MKDKKVSIFKNLNDLIGFNLGDNLNSVISEIREITQKYNEEDLILKISLISNIPGNEIYSNRFVFLFYLIQNNIEENNLDIQINEINKIFNLTEKLNWAFCEDYKPIKISKENFLNYNNKKYYYNNFLFDNP